MEEKNEMKEEKNKKEFDCRNLLIAVLFCIIFALVGLGVGYYFGTKNVSAQETKVEDKKENKEENKLEDKKEDQKEENKTTDDKKIEDKSSDEKKETKEIKSYSSSTSIKDLLAKEGYNAVFVSDSKALYKSIQDKDAGGDSFKNGNETLYISCSYELTKTKSSCTKDENSIIPSVYVYLVNNYYFVYFSQHAGDVKFDIYDKNLNKVSTFYSYVHFDGKNIFYEEGECEGKRSDGSVGNIDIIHKYNLATKEDTVLFNVDHDAGWTC